MPVSIIPPAQLPMPASRQMSWMRLELSIPPTLPYLMLMILQLSGSTAFRASSGEWMLSSRHTGVSDLRLELGMVDDVVLRQGLLHHEQVMLIKLSENRSMAQLVCRFASTMR